jgi:hypothetical protein
LNGLLPAFCATATSAKATDCVLYQESAASCAEISSSSPLVSWSRPNKVSPISTTARSRSSDPKV